MSSQSISFPSFPEKKVLILYFDALASEKLSTIKEQLVARNPDFNYCFLSTTYLVSMEQLYNGLHKAVQNSIQDNMKTRSINTEAILNLSPVNNINDSLRRFGVDESRSDVIVVHICDAEQADEERFAREISDLLESKPVALTDEILFKGYDHKKFKKLFKVQDASTNAQDEYTKRAIAGALLRGL